MQGTQRALVKVLILVPLAVISILFAIGPGGIVSYTPETRVSVHSLMAFWISIPAALVLLAYQKQKLRSNILMISAFVFSIVVHTVHAAENMLILSEPFVERVLSDTVADLIELALFSVLISAAMFCSIRQVSSEEQKLITSRVILTIFLFMPILIYTAVWFGIPYLTQGQIVSMSYVIGMIAVVGFLISSILIIRIRHDSLPVDSGYLVTAIILLGVASIVCMLSLPDPSLNWEFAETLQMAAFLLICLSLGVSFLKKSGYRRRAAYGFVIGLILMAYLPFLLTIVFESLTLIIILEPLNYLAYSIIHIGAASLSGTMAILLYMYPKKKTAWNHVPLILIFSLWTVVSVLLVFMFAVPSVTLRGEPTTPVVVGSAITLALLVVAIRWTTYPRVSRNPSPMNYAIYTSLFIILVVLAEVVNQVTLNMYTELESSLYGASLILGTNLVIMFTFTYLIFLLSKDSRGIPPVEMYIVFFLGMWILPNILKSYYSTWTTGWWVSEILLFVGLLASPPLLIWLYVRAMKDVQASHHRASLYADLLMHDVSNYNQMVMTTLELLGSEETSHEQRQRLADDGCQVITLSEQLISNVRLLSESDRLETSKLEPTNLVSTIVSALDLFTQRVGSGELVVEFKPEQAQAFVMANDFLVDIFLNILYSALECRIQGEAVKINLESVKDSGEDFWQVDIKAPGRSIDDVYAYSSSTLGLTAAKLMTQSLNGHFGIERYERVDMCEGRLFIIRLRMIN